MGTRSTIAKLAFVGVVAVIVFADDADTITVSKPKETYRHTQCRIELHNENPYGSDVLVWDTEDFGSYADGSVWVGYNRKVGDRVFYNLSKICG